MDAKPTKAQLRAEALQWFRVNALFAKRREQEDWDATPQPGSLFQLAADVLRRAECVRIWEREIPRIQPTLRKRERLCTVWNKLHFRGFYETETEFMNRILNQLRHRPASKILL